MTSLCMQNNCCSAADHSRPDRTGLPYPPHPAAKEATYNETLADTWGAGKFWSSPGSRDSIGAKMPVSRRESQKSLLTFSEPLDTGFIANAGTLEVLSTATSPRRPAATSPRPGASTPIGPAGMGRCNGRWADGAHIHVVQGRTIYWADGTSTEMEDTSPGGFSTTLWGTAYHGCLDKTFQVIHWNDGSEWMRLDESESSLDGNWRVETEAKPQRHAIRGTTLYWADGMTSEIQETSPGVFSTARGSQSYYCRLELCGHRLRWSDGDSWARAATRSAGVGGRRMRLALLFIAVSVVINCLYVLGMSLSLHRDWSAYPAEPKHPSLSWPEWQVWQFATGWAAMPLLLVHGVWATFLAVAANPDSPNTIELEAGKTGKAAMLWMLEPMRLVALMHIIMYHEMPLDVVGRWGYAWISFFMALAGFVGAYQLLLHDPDASKTGVCRHVWKRLKRLWPFYLIYIFVSSVPHYYRDSLMMGTVIPTWHGTVAAVRTLFSWMGLLYILGLQTLIPLDPDFDFVTRTCWFVPSLLLCEAFLPLWLRGIHTLLDLVARRIAQQERLVGKVEQARLLPAAVGFCFLAGAITVANSACIAGGKVYLRTRAFPDNDLSTAIFWFMRFTPFGHWAQVLLGAMLAKTFVMMQSGDPEGPDLEQEGCCPEEVVPLSLSPPGRSVMLMMRVKKLEEASASFKGLRQALSSCWPWLLAAALSSCWPWLLAAACSGCLACLAVHVSVMEETNSTVVFINCGAPAISFSAMIVCLSQASLELEPHWLVKRLVQAMGAVCFPAYLFVSMSQQLVWHFASLVFSPDVSISLAWWLRIPFIMLVQCLWDCVGSLVRVKSV